MKQTAKKLIDQAEIRRALAATVAPGQVVELRILNATTSASRYPYTASGYFNDMEALAQALVPFRTAKGIYVTLNPCQGALLARASNRLRSADEMKADKNSTADTQITRLDWLLIDADPDRPSGISSSDAEHNLALSHARHIKETLRSEGWPEPIDADSSNGAHLRDRIDLDSREADFLSRVLKGLAERFDIEGLHIDQTVFNPSRISKLYGTLACKGDDTDERPHRMSRILEAPEHLQVVPRELLEDIAAPAPASQPRASSNGYRPQEGVQEDFTAEKFLQKHHIAVKSVDSYNGGRRFRLEACAWDPSHTDNSACVYQFADGRLGASCSHNSCHGKGWRDFRVVFEPDAYTRNQQNGHRTDTHTENESEPTQEKDEQTPKKEESVVTKLMRITEEAKYLKTPSGMLYARVPVNGHHEIVSINEKGSGFRRWLTFKYKSLYGIAPNSDALSLVMSGVHADAEYSGEIAKVHTRIAYHNGCVYLDLANAKWQCIEISSDGWRPITCPPVYFRRPNGMLPLPVPKHGGTLDDLRELINAKEDKDYILITAWLVGTLHPTGPYAALNLNGESGSAKSKATAILRNLVDPNEAPSRSTPKDVRDASVLAQNNMIVALDNLSSMPLWLSDVLCRIATGSGNSARALYTDDEEMVFSAKRPIIVNGIEDGLITQPDLLKRTILVTLKPPEEYKTEEKIDELFAEMHPRLLGALLDAASLGLRDRRRVTIDHPPRMADFAHWVTAASPALGWDTDTFLTVFSENQHNATSIVMESSPLATALTQFMKDRDKWEGYMQPLFDELHRYEVLTNAKTAPKNARALSGQLKRIAPSLREQGIDVQFHRRTSVGSPVTITKKTPPQPPKYKTNVANESENVANDDKKLFATSGATAYETASDADSQASNVASGANVANFPPLYPSLSSHFSKEEKREVDKDRKFATLPSFATLIDNEAASQASSQHVANDVAKHPDVANTHFATPRDARGLGESCQTAFETLMSTPHGKHEATLQDVTGNHWCETCKMQHDLLNLGAERGYPLIHVQTGRPFKVQPGYEQWLRFAVRSGYENVRAALAVLEEKA